MGFLFGFSSVLKGFFDVFEAPEGAFLGFLGLPWEPLGASWAALGRSWGGLGATFGAFRFSIIFWNEFGSKKGTQREAFGQAKWNKNRSQNEAEI